MVAENERKARPPGKPDRKWVKYILSVLIIVVLLLFFLVPVFVSSSSGQKAILARINNSIDGRADFAALSMGWFKGIKVRDISYKDNSGNLSVTAKQLAAKPSYLSVLKGALSLGKTIIDQPVVNINLSAKQTAKTNNNSSTPTVQDRSNHTSKAVVLPVKKIDLVIKNGSVKVTDRQARSVEVSQINSKLNLRPPGQNTKFDVVLAVVDGEKKSMIEAKGQVKPSRKTGWALKGTSGELMIDTNNLDIGSLGPFWALAGVQLQTTGNASSHLTAEIKDGRFEKLKGKINCKDLDITGDVLKGDRLQTSVLDIDIELKSKKETIDITRLNFKSDWLQSDISGTVPTTLKSLAELLEPDSKYSLTAGFDCDIAAVLSQMPRTFGVKEEMKVTKGRLSGKVETGTVQGKRQIVGRGELVDLQGIVDGKNIALSQPVNADVQISSDRAGIKYDKLDVTASFCKVSCQGTSELLNYNADIDLKKIQAELGQFVSLGQYQIAGEFTSKGQVGTTKDKVTANGTSVIQNLNLTSNKGISASEPRASVSFAFDIDRDKDFLNVEFVKADAAFGQMVVNKSVLPLGKDKNLPLKMDISGKAIDLAKLMPFAVLFGALPKEMQLSGMAESELRFSSQKDIYRISTDQTKIKNLKVTYPKQKPFVQDEIYTVFDIELNPSTGTRIVHKFDLISGDIKIRFKKFNQVNQGEKTRVDAKADCEYDWAAVSTLAAPFLPEGLKLMGKRSDTISFASEYPTGQSDKMLENLNMQAKLGFEKAQYMGLNFGQTNVDLQIQNGLLQIAPFSTTVNKGQFNFAGGADFKNAPVLLKTPRPLQMAKDIQITQETTKQLLTYVNPVFANVLNASGLLNFNCEQLAIPLKDANKNDAKVIGTISITKLHLQAADLLTQILSVTGGGMSGQEITIHPTRFVLQDGFLRYDDMQMDVGDSPVNFKGVIGLDKTLDMTVTLPYTTEGSTVSVGKESQGQRVALPLRGTVDDPKLDLGKLLDNQLKQRLEQELRKGLEKIFK